MKERLGMTQLRTEANKMKFGEVKRKLLNFFYFLFILRLKKMLIKMQLVFQQV